LRCDRVRTAQNGSGKPEDRAWTKETKYQRFPLGGIDRNLGAPFQYNVDTGGLLSFLVENRALRKGRPNVRRLEPRNIALVQASGKRILGAQLPERIFDRFSEQSSCLACAKALQPGAFR